MSTYPARLEFILRDMPCEGNQRLFVIWIVGASKLSYAKIRPLEVHPQDKALNVSVEAYTWSHGTISSCVENHGRYIEGAAFVDVCVCLNRGSSLVNPVYESIVRMNIYKNLSANRTASAVVDTVYGRTPRGCNDKGDLTRFTSWRGEHACSISGCVVNLTHGQYDAVPFGVTQLRVVAIQVAFGTVETVKWNLAIVRYVSAATKNLTPTPVELNEILNNCSDDFSEKIENREDIELCQEFNEGREYLEPAEEEGQPYVSPAPAKKSSASASLLCVTASEGVSSKHMNPFQVLLGDEASQIPEPAMAKIADNS
ncbi:hypothetical protein ANCCAN_17446 [Ancylostoma caninum]|uniref:DNA2/NAM7 helicase helicase domain-containing protein n=1 Tax=Ancylostoma caninum TaxID=29170 RepID=A0A368FWT5_ANCCA|nr:hypothetical protein ANCCAN_17446 [Ancylostoma caninum]